VARVVAFLCLCESCRDGFRVGHQALECRLELDEIELGEGGTLGVIRCLEEHRFALQLWSNFGATWRGIRGYRAVHGGMARSRQSCADLREHCVFPESG
jgi:hypothetical protein